MVSGRRNLDLDIAAGHRCVHRLDDTLYMRTQLWPLLNTEHHDGDFPVAQILLLAQIFVGRQQNIEAGLFSRR
jgi:hypothetical protein